MPPKDGGQVYISSQAKAANQKIRGHGEEETKGHPLSFHNGGCVKLSEVRSRNVCIALLLYVL